MDIDKWEALKEELKRKFKVDAERTEDLTMDTEDGLIKTGTADVVEFETPMGKIKLSYESKPVVLDKKIIYSHQQGKSGRAAQGAERDQGARSAGRRQHRDGAVARDHGRSCRDLAGRGCCHRPGAYDPQRY